MFLAPLSSASFHSSLVGDLTVNSALDVANASLQTPLTLSTLFTYHLCTLHTQHKPIPLHSLLHPLHTPPVHIHVHVHVPPRTVHLRTHSTPAHTNLSAPSGAMVRYQPAPAQVDRGQGGSPVAAGRRRAARGTTIRCRTSPSPADPPIRGSVSCVGVGAPALCLPVLIADHAGGRQGWERTGRDGT